MSRGTFECETSSKNINCITFWTLRENVSARLSKLHSTCQEEHFWIFLKQKVKFMSFFPIRSERFLEGFFGKGCRNCFQDVQKNTLKKTFFWKIFFIIFFRISSGIFSDIEWNIVGYLSKYFQQCCQSRELFFEKFSFSLCNFFPDFELKGFGCCFQNWVVTCLEERFWEKEINFFWTSSENLSDYDQKTFGRVVRTAL